MSNFSVVVNRPTDSLDGSVSLDGEVLTLVMPKPRVPSKTLTYSFPLSQVAASKLGDEGYVIFYVDSTTVVGSVEGDVEDLGTHLQIASDDGEYVIAKNAAIANPVESEADAKPAAKKKAAAKPEAAPAKTKKAKEVEPEPEEEEEAPVVKKGKKAKAEEKPAAKPKKAAKADDFDDDDF